MADNSSLSAARSAKNDEFYTQYSDIEAEMNAYIEYNPYVFKDKTILLPCDDPEWSNFTKYFASNFTRLGIKKLISTSYARSAGNRQLTLFELNSPLYDENKHETHGKLFTVTGDADASGGVDTNDVVFDGYLEGDGDFRSSEVTALRDEADIIITNPPFSLFREFLAWMMAGKKQFVIIGNKNAITYKEVFPLLKENKMWVGYTPMSKDLLFSLPPEDEKRMLNSKKIGSSYRIVDGKVMGRSQSIWLTNIEHGKRHEELRLMTIRENLKFNKKLIKRFISDYGVAEYQSYENYDAIEIPFTEGIPSDYIGLMGVPITFLDKYNPDQFELVGTSDNGILPDKYKITQGLTQEFVDDYYKAGGKGSYKAGNPTAGMYKNGTASMIYKRLFIRHKRGGND